MQNQSKKNEQEVGGATNSQSPHTEFVSVCMYVYACLYVHARTQVCVLCMCVFVCVSLCVHMYMCVHVYVSVCVCLYLYMCVSVRVSFCLCPRRPKQGIYLLELKLQELCDALCECWILSPGSQKSSKSS